MKFKHDVDINGIQPEMVLGIMVVETVYQMMGYECIITSCLDGNHMRNSLHYGGLATDFRTYHLKDDAEREKLKENVQSALGPQFDVVLERTHLHVEYQP